jgi:hypothetical protein
VVNDRMMSQIRDVVSIALEIAPYFIVILLSVFADWIDIAIGRVLEGHCVAKLL